MKNFEETRTVTADGRLVIPWVVQRALGLEHGGSVRFRVDNGVVTLLGVNADEAGQGTDVAETRRNDIRAMLRRELSTLLAVAERDRDSEPADS